ncbi:SpoIIIAH-like family protein [Blautia sp. MSK.21.1]|uniref:SpoIIIAH-like family protein n=1 Tax=Blautia sp. MSK.21.1 TaxID=2742763 RepID=UPI00157189F3|nr:SpoIIIAH-like family protein [Blautia sp. MSK.21.1]
MKKIMKKNQVIITSLAILIAVAGYLNFADVDLGFKDKEASTDSSSILDDVNYDLTDETALLDENGADGTNQSEVMDTASPGEAVLTGASDFAAQAKISREQVRSQNKADLQAIISNKDISDEEKQNAINTMVSITDLTEKEAAAELLLEAKGFENVIVNLTGETADVVVPDADLEDAKRAQIEDIVKRKTGVAAESIVITPLSQSKEAADESASDAADTAADATGTENTEESTGDEAQDTAASVENDSADFASEEDTETAVGAQNDSTIDTEGIYD